MLPEYTRRNSKEGEHTSRTKGVGCPSIPRKKSVAEVPSEPRPGSACIVNAEGIVFGVHWSPTPLDRQPVNLDAICETRDANGVTLEVISPGRLASSNGSVVHTGDSLTGASPWDDERVFVFLMRCPPTCGGSTFASPAATAVSVRRPGRLLPPERLQNGRRAAQSDADDDCTRGGMPRRDARAPGGRMDPALGLTAACEALWRRGALKRGPGPRSPLTFCSRPRTYRCK